MGPIEVSLKIEGEVKAKKELEIVRTRHVG